MLQKMFIVIQRLTFCTIAITSTEISYWAKETAWVSTTTFQMFKDFCLYPGHSNISCTCFNSKIGFKVIGIDPDDVSSYEGSLIQNVGRERVTVKLFQTFDSPDCRHRILLYSVSLTSIEEAK